MAIDKKPMNVELEQGSMYSIEKKHIRKHIERITLPNGIAWTADNRKMFFVDSVPGKLYVYDFDLAHGDISTLVQKVRMPTQLVTSLCFGGPRYEDLFVTSGFIGLSRDQLQSQPDAGAIFKISGIPGTKGLPPNCFAM
ncbi:hypothetical protein V5799_002836 [Amblyomma americanum]|uniref:SMP-30/Gluconolactonase/LRE-like region domain-containing protein n=1 Tax=Amblyomma americanum TaxID=6943 RepID=A0AAQ4DAN9_AMBAM